MRPQPQQDAHVLGGTGHGVFDGLGNGILTTGGPQPLLGGLDVVVRRNAFGRQVADELEKDNIYMFTK